MENVIVTGVLSSRDSEIKGAIARIAKTTDLNLVKILKHIKFTCKFKLIKGNGFYNINQLYLHRI